MRVSGIISLISMYLAFKNLDVAIYLILLSISFRMSEDIKPVCELLKMLIVSLNKDEENE